MLQDVDAMAAALTQEGWRSTVPQPVDEAQPPFALVELGMPASEEDDEPQLLILEVAQGLLAQASESAFATLQLTAVLDIPVHASQVGETARLLAVLNRAVELPGLYLAEAESKVYYRLGIPLGPQGVEPSVLLHAVDSVDIVLEMYTGLIEDVALKRKTVQEVIDAAMAFEEEQEPLEEP